MWRLNNILLNNQWITEETKEDKKQTNLETNETESMMIRNSWDTAKALMGCPPSLYGICFYYDWALLPSCCSCFFVFGCRVYFFGKFQHFFVGCLSAVSCDFGVSIRRRKLTSFYLAILSLKFYYYFNFLYSVFWKLP